MVVSHAHLLMRGAIDGLGLAWVPATMAEQELNSGALTEVLADWKMTYEGYYMYYPNRNLPPLFRLFVDALKLNINEIPGTFDGVNQIADLIGKIKRQ